MNVLKFRLSGKTAFFKKPDVNSYFYFTYTNIHKVALLGLFGAILGYGGYNQYKRKMIMDKNCKDKYPEFYEKLKDIKIGIEPLNKNGVISKKIQVFNNSVGYASKEQGGNLIVKEQWLENPNWNIYILLDNDESKKICDYIVNRKSIFQPYLGKNDHFANITDIEVITDIEKIKNIDEINSLFIEENIEFDLDDEEEYFKYSERLPVSLTQEDNMYEFKKFIFTNMLIEDMESDFVYKVKNKNIMFF